MQAVIVKPELIKSWAELSEEFEGCKSPPPTRLPADASGGDEVFGNEAFVVEVLFGIEVLGGNVFDIEVLGGGDVFDIEVLGGDMFDTEVPSTPHVSCAAFFPAPTSSLILSNDSLEALACPSKSAMTLFFSSAQLSIRLICIVLRRAWSLRDLRRLAPIS